MADITKSKLPLHIVVSFFVAAVPVAIGYGTTRAEAAEQREKIAKLERDRDTDRDRAEAREERSRREAEALRLDSQATKQALQYVVEKVGEISQNVKDLKQRGR